ncbi:hypothetical protein B5X24_HaOG206070 [Helicoverpa armigera]|uniref:Uncharacterized protein n=1 Tax=Helicoverpa armigera TaxID=29058 RepID=A0A2W1BME4_HELAM|nr:hypothetical protein B5X24_HaOG206070 [Helicoverpa armigera]
MDDDDITVCSDDFLMDGDDIMNDSVTILKDFDFDNVICDDNVIKNFNVAAEADVDSQKLQEEDNNSQMTYFDSQLTPEIVETNIHNTNPIKDTDKSFDIPIENNDKNKDFHSDHNYSKLHTNINLDTKAL